MYSSDDQQQSSEPVSPAPEPDCDPRNHPILPLSFKRPRDPSDHGTDVMIYKFQRCSRDQYVRERRLPMSHDEYKKAPAGCLAVDPVYAMGIPFADLYALCRNRQEFNRLLAKADHLLAPRFRDPLERPLRILGADHRAYLLVGALPFFLAQFGPHIGDVSRVCKKICSALYLIVESDKDPFILAYTRQLKANTELWTELATPPPPPPRRINGVR